MVYRPIWFKMSSWQFIYTFPWDDSAIGGIRWIWSFQPQKKPGPGRPLISVTQEMIGEIEIGNDRQNCRLSCLDISLDKSTVNRVLVDVLGPQNMCSVWNPHKLSDQNKLKWVECANLIIVPFVFYSLNSYYPTIAWMMHHM